MKRILVLFPALMLLSGCVTRFDAMPDNGGDFKIMSYNILHGESLQSKNTLADIGKIINAEKPRFAAIQEVDQKTGRVDGRDTCQILSEATGMHATFARAIDLDGGYYGVAMLSREKPLSVRRIPLPGGEPRVLLLCEFEDCWAGSTHLDLNRKRRIEAVAVIEKEIAKCIDKPVFLSGDWNASPDSEVLTGMRKFLSILSNENQATWHGWKTNAVDRMNVKNCIDYIAVSKIHRENYVLKGRRIIPAYDTSDHLPLVVTVAPVKKCAKREGQFTIASFNVRCPGDVEDNQWKLRMPRVVKVVKDNGFDIFGVQEAVDGMSAYFAGELDDFERIGCGREKDSGGESMYIFYNRNRFKCIESGTFWLSTEPEKPGSRYPDAGCPRICTWGLFEDLVTGKRFRYFNTHLDHVSHQARLDGASVIMKQGLAAAKARGETIFLTGDMNAEVEKNDSVRLLAKIRKTDLAERAETNPIAFLMRELSDSVELSKYGHIGSWGTFHGYKPEFGGRIDYVFATPDVEVSVHATINDRPDGKFPSDHDPVAALVEIR